ncbi:MAG TPA: hypothetical protein VF435_20780 [Pyrinomonadaceae bacterium]
MKRLLMAITLGVVLSVTALAGNMPGVGRSEPGDMPGGGVTTTDETTTGEMPGDGSAASSETGSSLVTTLLLTIITVVGR